MTNNRSREWAVWEAVPVDVIVSDVDGDHWWKTEDSYAVRWSGKGDWVFEDELDMSPDNLDAPYLEVLS